MPTAPAPAADSTLLDAENIGRIQDGLEKWARLTAKAIPAVTDEIADSIILSRKELGAALREARTDLVFVRARRDVPSPSAGKVAGILTFRLCRHSIFHLPIQLTETDDALLFKEKVILGFVYSEILKLQLDNKWLRGAVEDENLTATTGQSKNLPNIFLEVLYMLRRRHYNQEILGVVFDAMRVIRQMAPLIERPPTTEIRRRP